MKRRALYNDQKGFTLIELLIVVAIIAILGAIAIPGYIGQQRRAARTEAFSNLETLRLLEEQYFAENGSYAPEPDGTLNYNPSSITITNTLSGFRPGNATSLSFEYTLTTTAGGTEFEAVATGRAGSRVAGETYTINHLNERTF